MATAHDIRPTPLRLWPGVAIVAVQWLVRYALPAINPELMIIAVFGSLFAGLAVLAWWVLFSRATVVERLIGLGVAVVAPVVTYNLLDVSIATGGQGMMFPLLATPILSAAFVAGAIASRYLPDGRRLAAITAAMLLTCAGWAMVRINGITGDFTPDFAWRWSETPEERFLAQVETELVATESGVAGPDADEPGPADEAITDTGVGWPGFRGPLRDGIVRGVSIDTDWSISPPVELWRRPIGPGWSSFAVRGALLYTQEQRGDEEAVSAYNVATGQPVWQHRYPARFWESHGGAGPRGTPAINGNRVYTFGATGILNALGADTGALAWRRDVAADLGVAVPGWGFAASPLVVGDTVLVAAAGQLAAYDRDSGEPRWIGEHSYGYSSPHLLTLDGTPQIVLLNGAGAAGYAVADGERLWNHDWPPGARIVQPAITADGELLISGGEATGMRRIAVTRGPGGWSVQERWTTIRLKPYFSDFVIHEGHAYGFDGSILAAIDIADGARVWKGGRYGQGQLLLLADQDLLLVISEDGELALVSAKPDGFAEQARFPAMDGKTWNHPVLVGDLLLLRNSEEMVAFRLTLSE